MKKSLVRKSERRLRAAERNGDGMTDLERRIGLVRERCSLTAFGAFALELLLLAEWDPDLNGTNGIYPDELFQAWEKNGPNAEDGGKTDRAELDKDDCRKERGSSVWPDHLPHQGTGSEIY